MNVITAQKVAHITHARIVPNDDCFDHLDYLVEDFQDALHDAFPSVYACNQWICSDAQAIAHNDFVHFCISTKNDKVSISVVPKVVKLHQIPLRDNWIGLIGNKFVKVAQTSFVSA